MNELPCGSDSRRRRIGIANAYSLQAQFVSFGALHGSWAKPDGSMQLTRFTDYALRTLLYLGSHPGQVVPASAISDAFGISPDHLAKAAKWLTQHGYVRGARGAGGG